MSDNVIRAEGVGKKCIIGHQAENERHSSLREVMARTVKALTRPAMDMVRGKRIVPGDSLEEFWALKEYQF